MHQYGMCREQLVEPSTGSSTTVTGASSGPVQPDSSLSTRRPAACSTGSTAASATRSSAYCPGLSVRARRSVAPSGGQRTALRRGRTRRTGRAARGDARQDPRLGAPRLGSGRVHAHDRVVVGDARPRVAHAGASSMLPSGKNTCRLPVRIRLGSTRPRSSPCSERNTTAVAVAQAEPVDVGLGHEHRVARGAGERILLARGPSS